jgi:hypothetical protein
MEKQNREQRRAAKFGKHQAPTTAAKPAPWPETAPNPVFGETEAPTESVAGGQHQDQTADTGAGSGGATEQPGRAPRGEGTHASNTQKQ